MRVGGGGGIGKVVSCPDQIFLHTLRTHRKVGSGKYDERVGRYLELVFITTLGLMPALYLSMLSTAAVHWMSGHTVCS